MKLHRKWRRKRLESRPPFFFAKQQIPSWQGLTKKMYRNIDKSFEEYLQKKGAGAEAPLRWTLLVRKGVQMGRHRLYNPNITPI